MGAAERAGDLLKEEIKMRDRAEKKIRLLQMKMESMKLPARLKDSEPHSSSSIWGNSLISYDSSATTMANLGTITRWQEYESDSHSRDAVMSVKLDNVLETVGLRRTDGGDNFNSKGIFEEECCENPGSALEAFKPDNHRRVPDQEEGDGVDMNQCLISPLV